MIKEATRNMICAVLANDPDIENWERKQVVDAMLMKPKRKDLITTKEAAAILWMCRLTVFNYVKTGRLHAIKQSQRKFRFDRTEVERLAYEGIN